MEICHAGDFSVLISLVPIGSNKTYPSSLVGTTRSNSIIVDSGTTGLPTDGARELIRLPRSAVFSSIVPSSTIKKFPSLFVKLC